MRNYIYIGIAAAILIFIGWQQIRIYKLKNEIAELNVDIAKQNTSIAEYRANNTRLENSMAELKKLAQADFSNIKKPKVVEDCSNGQYILKKDVDAYIRALLEAYYK